MKREAPPEGELAELIGPAFERLPEPDPRRLAAIEQRLLEPSRRSRRGGSSFAWWWLGAALAASAASAWWWAVDYDSGMGPEELAPVVTAPPVAPTPTDQPARNERPSDTESAPAGQPERKSGPVIYQRER